VAQLQRAPLGGARLAQAEVVRQVGRNITGITDQLEKEGLVVRTKVESDRRSSVLHLTPLGRKTFARMAKAHESWVMGMFGDMPQASRNDLYQALGDLKQQVVAHRSPTD